MPCSHTYHSANCEKCHPGLKGLQPVTPRPGVPISNHPAHLRRDVHSPKTAEVTKSHSHSSKSRSASHAKLESSERPTSRPHSFNQISGQRSHKHSGSRAHQSSSQDTVTRSGTRSQSQSISLPSSSRLNPHSRSRSHNTSNSTRTSYPLANSSTQPPSGPQITLCSCDSNWANPSIMTDRNALIHAAKHIISQNPRDTVHLTEKLRTISLLRSLGLQPSDISPGLTHWGICHIDPQYVRISIPCMRTWTVREQNDAFRTSMPEREALAIAEGGPSLGKTLRAAERLGYADHRHHLEMDTSADGGDPERGFERMFRCHERQMGHEYSIGCCGAGTYWDKDRGVLVEVGVSRSGGHSSRTGRSSLLSGSRAGGSSSVRSSRGSELSGSTLREVRRS